MPPFSPPPTNFACLREHNPQLVRLGMLAEHDFATDPQACRLKVRQYADLLIRQVAASAGVGEMARETPLELLHRLEDQGILPREIGQIFGEVRATPANAGEHSGALTALKMAWQLAVWFRRTFKDPAFKPGPFIPPPAPEDQSVELHAELQRLQQALQEHQQTHPGSMFTGGLSEAPTETAFWQQMVRDAGQAGFEIHPAGPAQSAPALKKWSRAAQAAASHLVLDEATTRQLIDQQLRQAGWLADSIELRFAKGTRPAKGKNLAIAEWPTAEGPADYVLFVGLTPVATVEAKRKNTDVSAALQQAKRYSRGFAVTPAMQSPGGPWTVYHLPFAFSSNGRPYLRQLETRSGIWFNDLRYADCLGRALEGWYTPAGLSELLKSDQTRAEQQLQVEPFDFGFDLRDYQQKAICAVEAGLAEGKRTLLLAMATGTGKTKTCIALIYRLLKVRRFRRVLFLVDRSALGEQAANAFKDTRMDSIRSFADIFGIKELDQPTPDIETAVHVATVQGMVKRILYPGEHQTPPAVDQYDCIVVDECHRGYLLDRELSDTELSFRSFEDYISKYRRVLDYFDAVKIGLTATPALHTTEIFGLPVYTYSYREAVIDGYLIDHEPPLQIATELSTYGITWKKGEEVKLYDPRRNQIELYQTPDEITLELDDFNRKVVTESFNRVICEHLARELDPQSRQKALIFCVNDAHADLVVTLLKKAFQAQYGSVEDDAVIKITGKADRPLHLIRRYKNERNPNVAVTVDLLTTGVDVPEICNLVFLRRVNSRILFDQMLGRATRLCPEIGKQTFRIFDAVRLYEALQDLTEMQPVVANPKLSFSQLIAELTGASDEAQRELIRDQLVAKLQRKRHAAENQSNFETAAGMSPQEFIQHLRQTPLDEIAGWFTANPALGEILDRPTELAHPLLISEHPDRLLNVEHGYGTAPSPKDYLQEFAEYIRKNQDTIPALVTVLTRPRDLTRKQLRELAIALDQAGFSEVSLASAWRELNNQEIAAQIVGFIRHIATGDPLVPYEQRVDWALQQMLAARSWSDPQRQWLRRIAAQTKVNRVVDREALDDPDLIFQSEGGGFPRLNRLFDGQLVETLDTFHELLWK